MMGREEEGGQKWADISKTKTTGRALLGEGVEL